MNQTIIAIIDALMVFAVGYLLFTTSELKREIRELRGKGLTPPPSE